MATKGRYNTIAIYPEIKQRLLEFYFKTKTNSYSTSWNIIIADILEQAKKYQELMEKERSASPPPYN